ncbi:MAG: hypothetical protein K5785_09295 [Nitrosarchaeum sp.]|nr:hypothetical protein [Nitrosarchaeum sp.]
MNHGRPNKSEQIHIEQKLWPYFAKMISSSTASRKTGLNINTVKKYYRKFSLQTRMSTSSDFVENSKNTIQQCVIAIDDQLLHLHKLQDKINSDIDRQQSMRHLIPLYKISINLSDKISHLLLQKSNLLLNPTADVKLEQYLKESRALA